MGKFMESRIDGVDDGPLDVKLGYTNPSEQIWRRRMLLIMVGIYIQYILGRMSVKCGYWNPPVRLVE